MTIIDLRTETTVSRQRFGIAFSEQRSNDAKCWPVMDADDIQLSFRKTTGRRARMNCSISYAIIYLAFY